MSVVDDEIAADQASRDAEISDLASVLNTAWGRAVLHRVLFEMCGVDRPSFTGEATHEMAWREGQRSVGIFLTRECLTASPVHYNLMLREAAERSAVSLKFRGGN